jgi:hypothetical protein
MFSYNAYGLGIRSDLALPELQRGTGVSDVILRLRPRAVVPRLPGGRWSLTLEDGRISFVLDALGVFEIYSGAEIVLTPAPAADMDLVRHYVLGTVMALLLYQRGLLPLHASCVSVAGCAVGFVAESGWGKSSLAAALQARGHLLLADDITAVDLSGNVPAVVPAFPQLKLSREAAHAVGRVDGELMSLRGGEEKLGYRPVTGFAEEPQSLSALYLLDHGPALEMEPLRPQDAMLELVRHSYPTRLLQSGRAQHFHHTARLAAKVPFFWLRRPRAIEKLTEHARLIEEHVLAGTPKEWDALWGEPL